MEALEKWLRRLFIASAFNTILWLSGAGCLVYLALMMTIIGIPLALLFFYSPTLLIYMLLALPTWLLLRRRSVALAAAASLPAMLAVGVLLPHPANRKVDEEVAALERRDHGGPLLLPTGKRVALLGGWDQKSQPECGETCQRLLFSGVASMVLLGKPAALEGKAPLTAWFIAPARGRCDPPELPNVKGETRDIGTEIPYLQRPMLSSRLSAVYGAGHCLFAEPRTIGAADIVLIDEWMHRPQPEGRMIWTLGGVETTYRARILFRENGRLVERLRNTRAIANWLAMPLRLQPPMADDSGEKPGHWEWRDVRDLGSRQHNSAAEFVRNDLSVAGLVGHGGVIYRMDAIARLTPED